MDPSNTSEPKRSGSPTHKTARELKERLIKKRMRAVTTTLLSLSSDPDIQLATIEALTRRIETLSMKNIQKLNTKFTVMKPGLNVTLLDGTTVHAGNYRINTQTRSMDKHTGESIPLNRIRYIHFKPASDKPPTNLTKLIHNRSTANQHISANILTIYQDTESLGAISTHMSDPTTNSYDRIRRGQAPQTAQVAQIVKQRNDQVYGPARLLPSPPKPSDTERCQAMSDFRDIVEYGNLSSFFDINKHKNPYYNRQMETNFEYPEAAYIYLSSKFETKKDITKYNKTPFMTKLARVRRAIRDKNATGICTEDPDIQKIERMLEPFVPIPTPVQTKIDYTRAATTAAANSLYAAQNCNLNTAQTTRQALNQQLMYGPGSYNWTTSTNHAFTMQTMGSLFR